MCGLKDKPDSSITRHAQARSTALVDSWLLGMAQRVKYQRHMAVVGMSKQVGVTTRTAATLQLTLCVRCVAAQMRGSSTCLKQLTRTTARNVCHVACKLAPLPFAC
jgi:hypothetical protein